MSAKVSPWLDTVYGWDLGEGGWNGGMDDNLLKFSTLIVGDFDDAVSTLPTSPVNGSVYFNTTDNRLYFFNEYYRSSTVPVGFKLRRKSDNTTFQFDGSSLVEVLSDIEVLTNIQGIKLDIDSLGSAAYLDSEDVATSGEIDTAIAQSENGINNRISNLVSWHTPQEYGGTATSGDDDTAALQAALNIDAAVRIPAGKYGVDGGLVWDYNALRLTGDGISSWIEGVNGHTLTVNSGQADGVIEHLWIDQKDLSVTPTYDAMRLNAGEMHVNFVDVDWADRYGIYVGGYRTSVLQYASQACREASIFVDTNAYAFAGTDITFENAGQGVPGNGIVQNGQRAVIKGVSAFNTGGYVWNLAGNYNAGVCAAAVFSNAAGAGTKSEDAYRVSGSFNAEAAIIARGTVGVAHHVTGNANSLHALVSDNSTKEALRVTGSNNDISGRFNAAGQDGTSNSITLTNTAARTNLSANTSAPAGSGRALSVASIENCITGVYDGTVIIDGGDSNYSIRCDSLILNSGNSNAVQAAITGILPIAAEIKSSSHALALTVNNAETNIAVVSGSSNIGYIRGSGASGDGIIISGNDNELQLRASGSGGNDLVISGSYNDLHINCAGNVRITGTATKNMITGVIRGNLTLENGSQGNRFFGKVLGTVTDSGSSNTVDATA